MKRIMNTRNGWAERIFSEMSSNESECRAGGDRALARTPPPDEIEYKPTFWPALNPLEKI
eukprot:4491076-Pleurochrysis_carterae.AAC.1